MELLHNHTWQAYQPEFFIFYCLPFCACLCSYCFGLQTSWNHLMSIMIWKIYKHGRKSSEVDQWNTMFWSFNDSLAYHDYNSNFSSEMQLWQRCVSRYIFPLRMSVVCVFNFYHNQGRHYYSIWRYCINQVTVSYSNCIERIETIWR